MDEVADDDPMVDPLIEAVENLSHFHREHEKFYAQLPREQAAQVQRHSRALCALADRWSTVTVEAPDAVNPFRARYRSRPWKPPGVPPPH